MKFACNNRIPGRNDYWIDFVKFISLSLFPPLPPFFSPSFCIPGFLILRLEPENSFFPSPPQLGRVKRKEGRKEGNSTECSTFPTCLLRLNYTVSLRRGGVSPQAFAKLLSPLLPVGRNNDIGKCLCARTN